MISEPKYDVETIRDIVYGKGIVTHDGKKVSRELWMDAYLPVGGEGKHPALIFTHGGSFHIGSPRTGFTVNGAQTTSPADYCRLFAGLGYSCFAIQYRLGPEDPVPNREGYTEDQIEHNTIALMMDRIAVIRENLNLRALDVSKPKDHKIMSNIVLSAAEDLRSALRFVINNADKYKVDKDRIVLGGFSAGAVSSVNVAHGMKEPVAGIFMLSGGPIFKITETVTKASDTPPILFFFAQHDLSGGIKIAPFLVNYYKKVGVDFEFAWVPAFGHFYPSGATSMGADGMLLSVEERIVRFVERVTNKG